MQKQQFQLESPSNLLEGIKWFRTHKTKLNGHRTDERVKSAYNVLTRTIKKMGIETMPIQNVNAGIITQLLVQTKKDRGFGNKRYNDLHSFLNTCFSEFYNNEWLRTNPFARVKRLPKEDTELHIPYTDIEFERIKSYLIDKEPFLWEFIEFMCFTGFRPNEIKQLTVGDINTENWTVRLRASVAKTRIERIVKIRPEYRPMIESWKLDYQPKNFYLFSNKIKGIGEKMAGKNAFSDMFFKHRPFMNITENHTLYGFRHTMALRIFKENHCNMRKVQKYLGHTCLRTTFNYLQKADFQNIIDDTPTKFPTI